MRFVATPSAPAADIPAACGDIPEVCDLDDRSWCLRTSPGQVTAVEAATVKEIVLAPEYRHMPLGTLAIYSQRIGKVFASVTTWAKLVRERGWRRPRKRLHPPKPTIGVRATRPNETWHVDVTVRSYDV